MLKHYFKIVWSRRRKNGLVIGTLFLAFILLAFVGSIFTKFIFPFWTPTGFQEENVFLTEVNLPITASEQEGKAAFEQIKRSLELLPEIEKVSISDKLIPNSPDWHFANAAKEDELIEIIQYRADDHYAEVMGIPILHGRWFSEKDQTGSFSPIVITKETVKEFFPESDPIGDIMTIDEEKYKVVGVIGTYRNNPENRPRSTIFSRYDMKAIAQGVPRNLLIKHHSFSDKEAFTKKIKAAVGQVPVSGTWRFGRMAPLADLGEIQRNLFILPITMAALVGLILISNVAVGLFGVFWNNVLSRFPEIGLRRAIGSRKKGVYFQILGEAFALVTIALIPGLLLFIQIPIFRTGNLEWRDCIPGIGFAAFFLYLLVTICALYPGWLAASLSPTQALYEE